MSLDQAYPKGITNKVIYKNALRFEFISSILGKSVCYEDRVCSKLAL